MSSAEEYLAILKQNALRNPKYRLQLRFIDVDDEHDKLEIQKMIERAKADNRGWSYPDEGMNPYTTFDQFRYTIPLDVLDRLPNTYHWVVEDNLFGIMPLGNANGHAISYDGTERLDKSIVLMNHGIVHVCAVLADALAGEILINDLEMHKRSGSALFRYALGWFSNPIPEVYNKTPWHILPNEVRLEFDELVGALQSNMLIFIALHEYAHIINGDTESSASWPSMAGVDQSVSTNAQSGNSQGRELLADEFAITHLSRWAEGHSTAWPNFAQAYLFLRWLQAAEETYGTRNASHPPARLRKEHLFDVASKLSTAAPEEDYVAQIEDLVASWL